MTFVAICFLNSTYAQTIFPIEKGNFLGGGKGRLSFSSQQLEEKYKETSIMVRPGFGYFLQDKWAVGINLNFENTKIKVGDVEQGKSIDFGGGIWTRYYFLPKSKRTNFFGEAGFNMGGNKLDDEDRINYSGFNVGLYMVHFINEHIAFEIGVDYYSKKYEDEDEPINKMGVSAGFQMHFTKKKKTNPSR